MLQPGLVLIKRALNIEQQKWLVSECFRYVGLWGVAGSEPVPRHSFLVHLGAKKSPKEGCIQAPKQHPPLRNCGGETAARGLRHGGHGGKPHALS